jgi:hypothetical protein
VTIGRRNEALTARIVGVINLDHCNPDFG